MDKDPLLVSFLSDRLYITFFFLYVCVCANKCFVNVIIVRKTLHVP